MSVWATLRGPVSKTKWNKNTGHTPLVPAFGVRGRGISVSSWPSCLQSELQVTKGCYKGALPWKISKQANNNNKNKRNSDSFNCQFDTILNHLWKRITRDCLDGVSELACQAYFRVLVLITLIDVRGLHQGGLHRSLRRWSLTTHKWKRQAGQ